MKNETMPGILPTPVKEHDFIIAYKFSSKDDAVHHFDAVTKIVCNAVKDAAMNFNIEFEPGVYNNYRRPAPYHSKWIYNAIPKDTKKYYPVILGTNDEIINVAVFPFVPGQKNEPYRDAIFDNLIICKDTIS